ncbi:hypothetical protein AX17_001747, partial [Amanita inopinata Kibby_2008]
KSPCSHTGPCSAETGCPCHESHGHCSSRCLCQQNCPLRWHGCNCSKSKSKLACTKRCPCSLAQRECDPDICTRCGSKWVGNGMLGLLSIYPSYLQRTHVQQSQWGFGLFIQEHARQNELIDEYVGELVFEPTTISRDHLSRHRGRNYVFSLNPTLSIDGAHAGNVTRYINHSGSDANCFAKIQLVNGEHRIGIMAAKDLHPGEELFLDYGPLFFMSDDQEPPDDADDNIAKEIETAGGPTNDMTWNIDHSSDETYDESAAESAAESESQ